MKHRVEITYCVAVAVVAVALCIAIRQTLDSKHPPLLLGPLIYVLAALFPIGIAVRVHCGRTAISKIATACFVLCGLWCCFLTGMFILDYLTRPTAVVDSFVKSPPPISAAR